METEAVQVVVDWVGVAEEICKAVVLCGFFTMVAICMRNPKTIIVKDTDEL